MAGTVETRDGVALFDRLLARLEQEGVRYCLLRDRPERERDLDELDVLVWPSDRAAFRAAARDCGFVACRNRPPLKEVHAAYDGERTRVLDVHFALVQGGLLYLDLPPDDRVARTAGGHRALGREDELLHLFFHSLVGKRRLQEKHLPRVRALLEEPLDKEYVQRRLGDGRMFETFEAFAADPARYATDEALAHRAFAELRRRLLQRSVAQRWRAFRNRRRRRSRGAQFVFLGVDGAGKTTTVEKVKERLERAGRVRYRTAYLGPLGQFRTRFYKWTHDHGWVPPRVDWLRRARVKLRRGRVGGTARCVLKWARGKVKGWAYYVSAVWELWYRYLRDVYPGIRNGELVLTDRYTYDLRYEYNRTPIRTFPIARWAVCRFFPRPRVVFFLCNDPEVIASRKAQLSAEKIRALQDSYRRAIAKLEKREIVTDRDPDAIAKQIVETMLLIFFAEK